MAENRGKISTEKFNILLPVVCVCSAVFTPVILRSEVGQVKHESTFEVYML